MSSRQRAWNAYEAAILLEGFLEIRSGTAPRQTVVARISEDLREMARRQGETIDDTFRNIAGINSQISRMESAVTGKTVRNLPATKLFTETVALYREDRAAYDRLLKEAKAIMNRDQAAPLVRTSADERLRSKYPVIYKRVFAALQAKDGNAGVSEIKTQIQDIGRASEIEEILDNASWSKPEGGRYRFSEEIQDHTVPSPAPPEPAHRAAASAPELYISDDVEMVKFGRKNQLEHTKPISLSYFGEVNVKVSNWRKVYLALLSALCRDYPERFHARMSFHERGNRYDLVQRSDWYLLRSPTFVDGTNYSVETNYSASALIRKMTYVLDLCRVDYENVVIRYRRDDDHPVRTAKPRSVPEQMRLLPDMEPEQKARYCAVLQQYFENGFHLDSNMGLNRFQKCYQELFNEELKGSSEEILANIQSLCVVIDGKTAYLPECLLSEECKDKLLSSIARSFANGAQCVYYLALYEEFREDREFQNYPICNAPTAIQDYLKAVCGGQYVFQSKYLAKDANAAPDAKAEIRACLQECGQPMSLKDLCKALPQYPQSRIRHLLSEADAFVNNGSQAYFLDSVVLMRTKNGTKSQRF